ncbi:MAG: (E)-4-hydroxy-3-methylbut-2-enyl-diphosphate synthase [Candidatus Eisenbacteria bacterium]|nr:(E)-4-hydroxy-3-methylbut-2-enyl-diphosphate synthase [Candidatus Eisenbacteria bacterium]
MNDESHRPQFPTRIAERHPTREVRIGPLRIGAQHPILIQSMTIADTCDTDAVVSEIRQLHEAGCPLVRVTAPSIKDAENLAEIKKRLRADHIDIPLVADIHFTPNAAIEAARHVEKVRVNPGNYADRKKFQVFEVTDAAYQEGMEKVRERFLPLVQVLKEEGRALRIGTNHGSLSDRILNRFGDTPEGMVESALEFVRICRDENFHDIVLSMKSSIPSVMIAAYRLLVRRMVDEGMDYPLHIGVTEAGDGIEGRVKSAIGIGSLLASGIGDTIRVSLTEDSIHELGACKNLLAAVEAERGGRAAQNGKATHSGTAERSGRTAPSGGKVEQDRSAATADELTAIATTSPVWQSLPLTTSAERRESTDWKLGRWPLGGEHRIAVELRLPLPLDGTPSPEWEARLGRVGTEHGPEIVSVLPVGGCRMGQPHRGTEQDGGTEQDASLGSSHEESWIEHVEDLRKRLGIVPLIYEHRGPIPEDACLERIRGKVDGISLTLPLTSTGHLDVGAALRIAEWGHRARCRIRWRLPESAPADAALAASDVARERDLPVAAFVCEPGREWIARTRALADALPGDPIFVEVPAHGASAPTLAGSVLLDGIGDAICLVDPGAERPDGDRHHSKPWPPGGVMWTEDPVESAYHILQACRIRLTRTEFIACPSCGRTQFDLQTTTAKIRARTGHLKGLKLAIMGCIVNGPGEMADADFGYVGSGAGRIDLYVGKERVAKNIPEEEAEDRLVSLLMEHGAWVDPSEGARRDPSEGARGE